jgi:WD40 repeat protein
LYTPVNQTPPHDRSAVRQTSRWRRWLRTPIKAAVVGPYLLAAFAVAAYVMLAIAVWRLTPLVPPRYPLLPQSAVRALSPDDRLIVLLKDGVLSLWDLETGRHAARLTGQFTPSVRCDFSPDSCWLSTCDEGTIHVWAAHSGEPGAHQFSVTLSDKKLFDPTVAFSPDSKLLAFTSASDGPAIKVWDVAGRVEHAATAGPSTGLHFSPDAKLLAFERTESKPDQPAWGRIYVWNLVSREMQVLDREAQPLRLLAFAPDGRTLAAAQRSRFQWTGGFEVKLWNIEPPAVKRVWKVQRGAALFRITPDGKSLVLQNREPGGDDWELTMLDLEEPTGNDLSVPRLQPVLASGSSISTDGKLLARFLKPSSDPPAILELPDLQRKTPLSPLPQEQRLVGGAFSPDSRWLALLGRPTTKQAANWLEAGLQRLFKKAHHETELHLYETATGLHRGAIPVQLGSGNRFTSDSRLLIVTGPGQTPTVWELPLRRRWAQLLVSWTGLLIPVVAGWWLYRRGARAVPSTSSPFNRDLRGRTLADGGGAVADPGGSDTGKVWP